MIKKIAIAATLATVMAGCATNTTYIDASDKTSNISAGLTYADFSGAADTMAEEIVTMPMFDNTDTGKRQIVVVNTITNDTMQRIDTDQLSKSIRKKLLRSGKFVITSAFGTNKDNSVGDFHDASGLKDSKLVKQETLKENNTVYAPDYSITGKIMQRVNSLDNGDSRIEYYFQLSMTNLTNGLTYYEGEEVVGKVADGDSVSW